MEATLKAELSTSPADALGKEWFEAMSDDDLTAVGTHSRYLAHRTMAIRQSEAGHA